MTRQNMFRGFMIFVVFVVAVAALVLTFGVGIAKPVAIREVIVQTVEKEIEVTKIVAPTLTLTSTKLPTLTPSATLTPNYDATADQRFEDGMTQAAPTLTPTYTATFTVTPSQTPDVRLVEAAAYQKGLEDGMTQAAPTLTPTLSFEQNLATRDAQVEMTVAAAGNGTATPSTTPTPTMTHTPSVTPTVSPEVGFVEAGFIRITKHDDVYILLIPEGTQATDGLISIMFDGFRLNGSLIVNTQNCSGEIIFPWEISVKHQFVSTELSSCVAPAEGYWANFTLQLDDGRVMTLSQQKP